MLADDEQGGLLCTERQPDLSHLLMHVLRMHARVRGLIHARGFTCADAGPDEILSVLMGSGVWGVVHEPADSGPFNAHDLDATAPILANIDLFEPLVASPPDLLVLGGEAGFGPQAFNISLAQARRPETLYSLHAPVMTLCRLGCALCLAAQPWHIRRGCRRRESTFDGR